MAEDALLAEMQALQDKVTGITGTAVASRDGLIVREDTGGVNPDNLAAIAATWLALAQRMSQLAGQGTLREAMTRSVGGYVAIYAIGGSAVLVVIGDEGLDIARMHREALAAVETLGGLPAGPAPGPAAPLTPSPGSRILRVGERELRGHRWSRAKYAAAFLRNSFSIFTASSLNSGEKLLFLRVKIIRFPDVPDGWLSGKFGVPHSPAAGPPDPHSKRAATMPHPSPRRQGSVVAMRSPRRRSCSVAPPRVNSARLAAVKYRCSTYDASMPVPPCT